MYRQTNYPWQEPYETDFLYAQRFSYEGLGLLAMDLLGSTALVSGLPCTPTGPASMSVQIGPGRLYSKQNLEPTAWGQLLGIGGLAVDTNADHQILKQALYRDTTVLTAMTAPVTVGQSQNYLIQAAFSEVDAVPQSLPFVSSTPPYASIAPTTLNTVRQDLVVITVKAGTPATTGSQTTPAPDAGNVGLWVVTIAQGQTSITSGNISAYGSAPFITETLTQKISQAFADARYLRLINARTQLTAPTTFYVSTAGNDSTGDGSVGNPWLTIQRAINVVQSFYDTVGFSVAIQLADGLTYAGATMTGGLVGGGVLTIQGNSGTPANVRVAGPLVSSAGASMAVQNFQINSSADCLLAASNGLIRVGVGMIFGAATGAHIYASQNGEIDVANSYSVVGSAAVHWQAISSGRLSIAASITITFTGAPTLTLFASIITASVLSVGGLTFSGATTAGTKYNATLNSVISTGGQTFPGVTGGSAVTGAQYQ